MKKVYTLILFVVFLSSCDVEAPIGGLTQHDFYCKYNQYMIHIDSDPQGAAIEWNNQYIGRTPLDYPVTGELGDAIEVLLVATPAQGGQYTQTKVLYNPLPNSIYFNMNMAPATNYNIYNH